MLRAADGSILFRLEDIILPLDRLPSTGTVTG